MSYDSRRLDEIREEKKIFEELLDNSETITDCLTYQGEIELLEKEEKDILQRMG